MFGQSLYLRQYTFPDYKDSPGLRVDGVKILRRYMGAVISGSGFFGGSAGQNLNANILSSAAVVEWGYVIIV